MERGGGCSTSSSKWQQTHSSEEPVELLCVCGYLSQTQGHTKTQTQVQNLLQTLTAHGDQEGKQGLRNIKHIKGQSVL